MRRTDPLIVGGGPAGASVALALARGGQRPTILERRREVGDIVCGGFLGWDALAGLDRLGIDVAALGAQPIERVRIFAGTAAATARLPHRAAGLSRATLDAALLRAAIAAGAGIERGIAVREIERDAVRLADGTRLAVAAPIVATGKHALRGCQRRPAGEGAVGLRTTIAAPHALTGAIELHLFRGGYAGLLVQEDGRANLCLSVSPARLAEAGGRPERLLAALADEAPRLADHAAALDRPWATIAGVPYGWRGTDTGPWRIGDQAAVVASLMGDGIAIALASGRAAAAARLRGEDAATFQRGFAARARRPLAIAELVRGIAERPLPARAAIRALAYLPDIMRLIAHATRIGD